MDTDCNRMPGGKGGSKDTDCNMVPGGEGGSMDTEFNMVPGGKGGSTDIRVHQISFFCEFQKEEYGICLPRVLEEEKFFFFLHHPPIYTGSLKYADFENFHRPRKKYFLIFFFKNVFLYISRTL